MTSIKFLGGIGEIGGNKFFIEQDNFRFFLDFGLSFGMHGTYYDEFLKARRFGIIDEYVGFRMLPEIKGIYREDYLSHSDTKHALLGKDGKKSVDAVFISHAHLDHIGMIPFLRNDIDLFGSETTKRILTYLQETSSGVAEELLVSYPYFRWVPKKRGDGMKKGDKRDLQDEKMIREYTVLSNDLSFQQDDIEINLFDVDHSLPGAAAYIIKTPDGNIAFTGDLRFHGYYSDSTKNYAKALESSSINILLCEGTRAGEEKGLTEPALMTKMTEIFNDAKNLTIINYPQRDTSRMKTISDAAKSSDRTFVISPKQAYYLTVINDGTGISPLEHPFEILIPRKGWGIWGDSRYDEEQQMKDYTSSFTGSLKDFIFEQSNLVTPQEIHQNQGEYVVTATFWDLGLLHDLKPIEKSVYIWSHADPFDPKGEINFKRVLEWLNHFGLGEPVQLHCSGHLSGPEIKELIDVAKPEIVVPIHTQRPELFKDWHDDVRILQLNDELKL